VLDELIRAALNEAAADCAMPPGVDERILLAVQHNAKTIGEVPND